MPVVLDTAGNGCYGKVRLALNHSIQRPAGQNNAAGPRSEHELTRAGGHDYLLALAKHEVSLPEASAVTD